MLVDNDKLASEIIQTVLDCWKTNPPMKLVAHLRVVEVIQRTRLDDTIRLQSELATYRGYVENGYERERKLKAERDNLRAQLERLQWNGYKGPRVCESCGTIEMLGHHPTCWTKRLLDTAD